MRRISTILTLALISFGSQVQLSAQTIDDFPVMREIRGKKLLEKIEPQKHAKHDLWGYVNPEGKFTIKPVFTAACPFEGNLARISIDHKWGIISNRGLYQVLPCFDRLERFSSDSLAVAGLFGRCGLVNNKGKVILNFEYDDIQYAEYGYIVRKGGLYGTVDHKGKVLTEPFFDDIAMLDKDGVVEHVCKDGKWGLLHNGSSVLTMGWDSKVEFLQNGIDNHPALYLARKGGRIGVVTVMGQYVVPSVYDSFELASSGEYYITTQNGKYGAVSLKMVELIPPIMAEKPFIGENIFKVHDDGRFYCANVAGCIKFEDCADLYYVFKPEEYVTTKYLPQWAKTHIIEENLTARQTHLDEVRSRTGSVIPAERKDRYGLTECGEFVKSSGTVTDVKGKNFSVIYKASGHDGNSMYLVSDSSGEYYMMLDDYTIPVRGAFADFNIKKSNGFYPYSYTRVSDNVIKVCFAFVRPAGEVSTSIIETNPYLLPVDPYALKAYTGTPNRKLETAAVMTFAIDSLKATGVVQLAPGGCMLEGSRFGGFYVHESYSMVADGSIPLRKYDRNGVLDWEYRPASGETFYDIEETENYIYICGSTKSGLYPGKETPLLVKLSRRGKKLDSKMKDYQDARFTGLLCDDCQLYAKTSYVKGGSPVGKDYYPMFNLEDMGDNVGVRPSCVWEKWGTGYVGGLGLTSDKGVWLQTPMLSADQMCTAFDWEFSGFSGDYLVVRHMGLFGLMDRKGELVIDTKYDLLEPLNNPLYFRAVVDGRYGVIDADGKVVIPFEYSYVGNMSEDVIVVCKDELYGCFDKNGTQIVPMEYEEIREYVDGMARIRFKGRFGFIDKKGEIVVAPFSDEVENFSDGCALVTIKNKIGFVTLQGDWIAPPMYDAGESFSAGLAPLSMAGRYGYMDKTGDFVIPMQYTAAKSFDQASGLACVANGAKWGVIDRQGKVVLPLEYDKVEVTPDGFIYVENGGYVGIFSQDGQSICPVICEGIERMKDGGIFKCGVANGTMQGQRVRIDNQGNIIRQYSML